VSGAVHKPVHAHKRPQRTEVPPRMSLILKTIVIGHCSRSVQPVEIKIFICVYRLENSIKLVRRRLVAMYESHLARKVVPVVTYEPKIRSELAPLVGQRVNL
jgi:hypothetical protein